MRKRILPLLYILLIPVVLSAQTTVDSLCTHRVVTDEQGNLLPWYQPQVPGAGFDQVVRLASEFIKNRVPVEPTTGLKLYMVHADFNGPLQDPNFDRGTSGTDWMPNPACVFAGFVQSLAVDYRVYSGDPAYLDIVRDCLDQMLENGTTPADWPWPNCPYASADPRSRIYQGATEWENEHRGDGLHVIEPDKVGELGVGYLKFYEITGEQKYLTAAIHCADALAQHVRDVQAPQSKFATDFPTASPWPFRVNAQTDEVVDPYTSNVVEPIRLFDELLRIRDRIHLSPKRITAYHRVRQLARDWLFSKNGPMITYLWNGYFEDVPSDPRLNNRVQITPMETARYILKHPEFDPDWQLHVPALLAWVESAFATDDMDAIKEQTWCYAPMGSHTARFASVCALWYQRTGDVRYKGKALRYFNFATYMCEENGYVWVGPDWPTAWFSDGYGDYIRHFMEGLGAIPEWAPVGEDHLLHSTSVVRAIRYAPEVIRYDTFDPESMEVLRLAARPQTVMVAGKALPLVQQLDQPGWTWRPLDQGGVLQVQHAGGGEIVIRKG